MGGGRGRGRGGGGGGGEEEPEREWEVGREWEGEKGDIFGGDWEERKGRGKRRRIEKGRGEERRRRGEGGGGRGRRGGGGERGRGRGSGRSILAMYQITFLQVLETPTSHIPPPCLLPRPPLRLLALSSPPPDIHSPYVQA